MRAPSSKLSSDPFAQVVLACTCWRKPLCRLCAKGLKLKTSRECKQTLAHVDACFFHKLYVHVCMCVYMYILIYLFA